MVRIAASAKRRPPTPESKPLPATTPLTLAEKKLILKRLGLPPAPGSNYVTLTPTTPSVANRGALVFVNLQTVECGEGWARCSVLEGIDQAGVVNIWLRSGAGRKYLVDATLWEMGVPHDQDLALTMVLPDDQRIHLKQGTTAQHLVAALDAVTEGWYRFQVFGVNQWRFYSCEVTNL